MSNDLQTWWVRDCSGVEWTIGGVSGTGTYDGYVIFYDKNDNLQASFYRPEFYARTSILEGEDK